MLTKAVQDTKAWDTAVELKNVTKEFVQKQREEGTGLRALLTKTEKRIVALNDVSLTVPRGEFIAYAGPNGAGKSTTFKLLCGMLSPQSGTVRTMGLDPIAQRIPLMKELGVLFGNRTELWWDHPVLSSFEWKKEVWDIPDAVYQENLATATELLDLKPFMGTFVRELSLGQRMRAELGLMLLHSPQVVLLDEPTLGLDVLAKRQMIGFLKHLNSERGVTIMVTSHDMDDLTAMAHRLVLIADGKVAFDGTESELLRRAGDSHTLTLTRAGKAPTLTGAVYAMSEEERHTYTYQGSAALAPLLSQIAALDGVKDVELEHAPIEQVIADLYKDWSILG